MNRRRFLLVLLAPLLALLMAEAGCGRRPSTGTPGTPSGQKQKQDVRIVVLAPALGVICRDLGLGDEVVGKHAWDMAFGDDVPSVGTHDDPDLEALIRVRPTHILVQDMEARVPESLRTLAAEKGWVIWGFPLLTLDDIAHAMDEIHLRLVGLPDLEPNPLDPTSIDPSGRLGAELPSARLADAWRDRGEPARHAGRVLLLASTDPANALGPGSFHHQLLERLGARPAITTGGPWQELDHEDILRLAPDSILLFQPRAGDDTTSPRPTTDDALKALGGIAGLDIPAVRDRRVAIIDHPLGLLPASSLGEVGDDMGDAFERWDR